ncbi:hypothetical protein ACH0BO_02875 [Brevibacterium luteolum]
MTDTLVSPAADLATPLTFAYWVPNVSGGLARASAGRRRRG